MTSGEAKGRRESLGRDGEEVKVGVVEKASGMICVGLGFAKVTRGRPETIAAPHVVPFCQSACLLPHMQTPLTIS